MVALVFQSGQRERAGLSIRAQLPPRVSRDEGDRREEQQAQCDANAALGRASSIDRLVILVDAGQLCHASHAGRA